ncbi:MAG TPA: hypothetical protein VGW34_10650 [Allosphingosinicella sp.]|nr:hypothetical protein [Allosphingosinicella sp.]
MPVSTGPSSLEKAFRGAVEDGGALLGVNVDAEQLDLMRDEAGKLPTNVFQITRTERGRGRPRGSVNKRNQKLAKLICHEHGNPVLFMASVYSRPLDQLVELLRIADGSADREARLMEVVEQSLAYIGTIRGAADRETLTKLTNLVDRLADLAGELRSKPGELALKALVTQLQAAKATAEYTDGKQPVSIDVKAKADLVVFAPELLKQHDIDPAELETAINARGLEAFDLDEMRLLPAPEYGEDEEAEGEDD